MTVVGDGHLLNPPGEFRCPSKLKTSSAVVRANCWEDATKLREGGL